MSLFLKYVFIFFIGSTYGYIQELFFRRTVYKKWVNPGFLIGPYLPIYGFGLCVLTLIYLIFSNLKINPVFIILLMGLCMTLIELIGGLIFVVGNKVKLWDYSNMKWNYKGVICPQFSLMWTLLGAFYYYFIADKILSALNWFSNNLSFSYILGIFSGLIVLDYIYSTNTLVKIRKFAKNNDLIVKYEEFKKHIVEVQEKNKEKHSFIFPFKQKDHKLLDYLNLYKKDQKKMIKKENKMLKKGK